MGIQSKEGGYSTCLQIDTFQQIVVGALPVGGYLHESLQIVGRVLFVHLQQLENTHVSHLHLSQLHVN